MKKAQLLPIIVSLTIMLSWTMPITDMSFTAAPVSELGGINSNQDQFLLSASTGIPFAVGKYAIIQYSGLSIPARGDIILQLVNSEGIVAELHEVTDLLLDSSPLLDSIAIVIDGSLGSANGTSVSDAFIEILIRYDRPVILVGRSAWLLHRLRDRGPPLLTAPGSQQVFTTSEFTGAVFLSMPYSISNGGTLTTETLTLPIDDVQTEKSRIIMFAEGETSNNIAPLRYDSWPLDTLLFGIEDPAQWTTTGRSFFINTIAYSTTLSESEITNSVSQTQSDGVLAGG